MTAIWFQSALASEYVVLVIDQGLMFPSVEYFVEHVMDSVLEGSLAKDSLAKAGS